MKNYSLQKQVAIRIIPTLLIFWIFIGLVVTKLITDKTYELLDSSLKETAERILPLALIDIEERSRINADIELVPLPLNDEVLSYQIQNKDGKIVLRSHRSPMDRILTLTEGFNNYQKMRVFTTSTENGLYKIHVFEPISHRSSTLVPILLYFLIPFLLIIPVTFWFIKNTLKFLPKKLNEYNSRLLDINQGTLDPIPLDSLPEELRGIGRSVNILIHRLKGIITTEKNFSENVAHELRTPIAVASAQLDVLKLSLHGDEELTRLSKAKISIQKLEHLITKFLQISRAEFLSSNNFTDISVVKITQHVIDQLKLTNTRSYNIQINEHCDQVRMNAEVLGIIMTNLLENANKYSIHNTQINVILGPGSQIRIQNESPLLSKDTLETIMTRYQRNSLLNNGFGLGLSIVQMLVEKNNGKFELFSPIPNRNDGVEARIEFF